MQMECGQCQSLSERLASEGCLKPCIALEGAFARPGSYRVNAMLPGSQKAPNPKVYGKLRAYKHQPSDFEPSRARADRNKRYQVLRPDLE